MIIVVILLIVLCAWALSYSNDQNKITPEEWHQTKMDAIDSMEQKDYLKGNRCIKCNAEMIKVVYVTDEKTGIKYIDKMVCCNCGYKFL